MKKVRFIRAGYFVWVAIPIAAFLTVNVIGLPHMLWSYDWRGTPASYGDIARRHYTRCTYIGPHGAATVYPAEGACSLFRFLRPSEASR